MLVRRELKLCDDPPREILIMEEILAEALARRDAKLSQRLLDGRKFQSARKINAKQFQENCKSVSGKPFQADSARMVRIRYRSARVRGRQASCLSGQTVLPACLRDPTI